MAPKTVKGVSFTRQKARLTSSRPGYICNCLLIASIRIEQTFSFCVRFLSVSRNLNSLYLDRDETRVEIDPRATIENFKSTSKRVSKYLYSVPFVVLRNFGSCVIRSRQFNNPFFLYSPSKPLFLPSRNTSPHC